MAHGPDTDELLRRVADATTRLDVSGLNITSLPDLPSDLKRLDCNNTQLTSLPTLPSSLVWLICSYTSITSLPTLPSGLIYLDCYFTNITSLPTLPSSLIYLYCFYNSLRIYQNKNESIHDYEQRWKPIREEDASKKRCQDRCFAIRNELMAAAWDPKRVEKWLEIGGFELYDSLL